MKRFWSSLASTLIITMSATSFQQVSAQGFGTVYCTNCGTELTQIANKLMMVEQLANQAQQIATEVNQLQDMLLNSKAAPGQIWGTALQDFNQLKSLLGQSQSLAYTAGNLDQQFATKYGTYSSYLAQKMAASDWQSKYSQWSKESSDNALYALKGLGLQASQMQDEQAMMQQLQGMAGTAQGRMQALQVANMMAAANVDQVQKLRQLMMMQIQMQANYLAMQQDKEAAQKAQRQILYTNWKDTPDTDGKVY